MEPPGAACGTKRVEQEEEEGEEAKEWEGYDRGSCLEERKLPD